jgi:hypothetical protein
MKKTWMAFGLYFDLEDLFNPTKKVDIEVYKFEVEAEGQSEAFALALKQLDKNAFGLDRKVKKEEFLNWYVMPKSEYDKKKVISQDTENPTVSKSS